MAGQNAAGRYTTVAFAALVGALISGGGAWVTLGRSVDAKVTEPEVIEIFDSYAAFSGLPGNRAAALMTVSAMNSLVQGAYRPKKGNTRILV